MKKAISGTTGKIYEFICTFSGMHGYTPSVREIAAAVGIKSTSTVFYHIEKLQSLKLINKYESKKRAIEIVGKKKGATEFSEVPIIGQVSAGLPILAVENVSDTLSLPSNIFGGGELFMLRVKGDSMTNAGILDGDLIAVEKQPHAENGDIVVAMLDDEVTVKRFFKEKDRIRLQPENDNYSPIYSNDVYIIGKAVGLLRNFS